MGQDDATRLQDASAASGPLWCVPVAAGIIAVWHDLSTELELVGIEGSAGLLTPHERHRIFSPRFSKPFYTVAGRGLQDGRRLRAILRDESGAEIEEWLDLRLAHWQIEGVPQIVSFIVSRILPKLSVSDDHGTLERFLSLVSSWRSTCRLVSVIGPHSLYRLDAKGELLSNRQIGFFLRDGNLAREQVNPIGDDEQAILFVPDHRPERAYLEIGSDLVELEFSNGCVTDIDAVAWLHGLVNSSKQALFDCLSVAAAAGEGRLPAYLGSALTPVDMPLGQPDAYVSVQGCFSAADTLFLFLEVSGAVSLPDFQVEIFGSKADETRSLECRVREAPDSGSLSRARMVATASLNGQKPLACRVVAMLDGYRVQQWLPVQAGNAGSCLAQAQHFWPFAEHDESYLSTVAMPLAQEWLQRPVREHATIANAVGRIGAKDAVDLHIVGLTQLDALHGTLIGLRSSVPSSQALRVTFPSSDKTKEACSKVIEWAERYGFGAQAEIVPSHAPDANAADFTLRSKAQDLIAMRAGFIPPHAGWLDDVAGQLKASPDAVLIGIAPNRLPGQTPVAGWSADALVELLVQDALAAIAASADLLRRVSLKAPATITPVGRWVEWLMEAQRRGGRIVSHSSLAFLPLEAASVSDSFRAKIDGLSLLRKHAATEHREAPETAPGVIQT